MLLITGKTKRKGLEDDEVVKRVCDLLFQPITITSFNIFPSQFYPGKEAVRIMGWRIDGKEFDAVTESKLLVETIKEVSPGDAIETVIVKNNKTGGYLFSGITRIQQKELQKIVYEKRQQYLQQNGLGDSNKQGGIPSGSVQRDGKDIRGTSEPPKD